MHVVAPSLMKYLEHGHMVVLKTLLIFSIISTTSVEETVASWGMEKSSTTNIVSDSKYPSCSSARISPRVSSGSSDESYVMDKSKHMRCSESTAGSLRSINFSVFVLFQNIMASLFVCKRRRARTKFVGSVMKSGCEETLVFGTVGTDEFVTSVALRTHSRAVCAASLRKESSMCEGRCDLALTSHMTEAFNSAFFKHVLRTRGWLLRAGEKDKPVTHLFLDGGRASVPDDDAGLFLNIYATAISKKERLAVVEVRTPVFKLFLDLDARVQKGTPYDFEPFFERVASAVLDFFCVTESPCLVVCSTDPKDESDDIQKCGFHLIWTNVFVSSDSALAFRNHILDVVVPTLPTLANSWEDAIDACVFKSNGLRMPWSYKSSNHTDTRIYVPQWTFGDDRHEKKKSRREWIHALSIRVPRASPTPTTIPVVELTHKASSSSASGGIAKNIESYRHAIPGVAAVLPPEYGHISFTGMFKCEHIAMLRTTNKYCANVGREHKASQIYFAITRQGISQRCYCRKDPQFGNVACKDFVGETYPLPEALVAAFLGRDAPSAPPPLPSSTARGTTLDELLKRSRPSLRPTASRGKRKK
jgi:hypothetical protein